MDDQDIAARLAALEEASKKTFDAVDKMRKYFLWTLIGSLILFVLPLLGLLFAIPSFLSLYNTIGSF